MKNSELQICCRVRGNGLRMVLVFGTKLLIILLFIRGAADLASVPMCTPACKLRSTSSVFVVPRSSQCCEHPRIAASRWRFTVTSFPCCSPGGNRWRDKLCNIDAVTDEECAVVVDGRAFALAEEDFRAIQKRAKKLAVRGGHPRHSLPPPLWRILLLPKFAPRKKTV